MRSILIIDDDLSILKNLSFAFKTKKITVFTANTGKNGLEIAAKEEPEIVFLDYKLPDTDGLKMIPKILAKNSHTIIVMITGVANLDIAVKAIKEGAYDFVEKPFDIDKIFAILKKTEKEKLKQDKVLFLEEQLKKGHDPLIGQSEDIKEIKRVVDKVIKNPNFTILVSGESGTGKEVLARYLHEKSLCADKPLVAINCSAIPDNLLESELFGYEKGAFTDAQATKRGLFEIANDGIIFLDEIGDMKLDLQAKILRVLENKVIRRIGGSETIPLNISIIAATNKDLPQMIKEKKFREDLYYRLNVIPIKLSPLRERSEDISLLADYFIKKLNNNFRKKIKGISSKGSAILNKYSFPGNVRELRNILERAMLLESGNELSEQNFLYLTEKNVLSLGGEKKKISINGYDYKKFKEGLLKDCEKEYFEQLMAKYSGNVSKAAEHAGIMVQSLSRILKRLGIKKESFK